MSKQQISPLEPVEGSYLCQYSVIENKLAKLYRNQEKIYKLLQEIQNISIEIRRLGDLIT